jgi:IclR family pca regulon transcriptional regulator
LAQAPAALRFGSHERHGLVLGPFVRYTDICPIPEKANSAACGGQLRLQAAPSRRARALLMASIATDDPDFVNALARGLGVITCFGKQAEVLTLSQIAAKTGLTRGTARRFLLTLEALGYVRCDGRLFQLTPKVLNLGYAYLSSLPLWQAAQPIMKDVVDELDESCSIGALDGQDVVYICRIPPKHLSFIPIQPGTRMPAHINAMGQVLLAQLSSEQLDAYFRNATFEKITKYTLTDEAAIRKVLTRVAKDRYAISDRQLQIGIRSIAVPIPARSGYSQVAINAAANEGRASKRDLIQRFLPVLRRAADQIAHAL